MDLGSLPKFPTWLIHVFCLLAGIGFIAVLLAAIFGIFWVLTHLRWV